MMRQSHRTSRVVFLFCFCCDARSMQATFGDPTNAKVWHRVVLISGKVWHDMEELYFWRINNTGLTAACRWVQSVNRGNSVENTNNLFYIKCTEVLNKSSSKEPLLREIEEDLIIKSFSVSKVFHIPQWCFSINPFHIRCVEWMSPSRWLVWN